MDNFNNMSGMNNISNMNNMGSMNNVSNMNNMAGFENMENTANRRFFFRVGYAFVPEQRLSRVYQPKKALMEGTVFPELNISMTEYVRGI